uniref:cutinase family protein n=1 Tax=Nocardia suismassiliense TaxID=2077092 RepID=UPI003F49A4C9
MKRPGNRNRIAATAAVTSAATVATLLTASASGAAPSGSLGGAGCAPINVVMLAGTTETNPSADPDIAVGTMRSVTDPLKQRLGNKVRIRYPGYSASAFDKGLSYAASKDTGKEAGKHEVATTAAACPQTKFILGGFSQGAHAIMDLALDIGNGRGPVPADRVLAVGTISDPGQGTPGQILVGPPVQGQGIAGPRAEGVGALKGRVATICRNQPVDLYCATNRAKDGLIASLGSMLGNSTGNSTGDQASQLTSSMVSDFTGADLGSVPGSLSTLTSQLSNPGTLDPKAVTGAASNIVTALQPVTDLVQSLTGNPKASQALSSAPAGSPEALAGQALDVLKGIDLNGVLDTATRIMTTAQNAFSGSPTSSTGSPQPNQTAQMAQSATELSQQMQPLTTQFQPEALTTATNIFSTLRPNTVINQVLNAATGVTTFALNIPRILDLLFVQLPAKIVALDVPGAHQVAGELNNQFQPLIRMAAGVDLKWIGSIVGMIPDPQGFSKIAAVVLNILGNVDVIRLANDVGALQEAGWRAAEALAAGRPVDAGLALTGLLAPGLDLASVAFGTISGSGQKTDPNQLGQLNPANQPQTVTGANSAAALPGLAQTLTDAANSQGAKDLQKLISEGLGAATFYGTNAHNLYGDFIVDGNRNAFQWMTDWFVQQAAKAGA